MRKRPPVYFKVTFMYEMFYGCSALNELTLNQSVASKTADQILQIHPTWVNRSDGEAYFYENALREINGRITLSREYYVGWEQIGGEWYYFDSDDIMLTGWQEIGGTWYYLGTDGAMRTDWQQIAGTWYYLGSNGAMRTGWQQIAGKWYYLGSDGAMRTGWQQISKKWYYLGSDGVMRTGRQEIDGKSYNLGSDGALVN